METDRFCRINRKFSAQQKSPESRSAGKAIIFSGACGRKKPETDRVGLNNEPRSGKMIPGQTMS
jgi:hypothetical protein